MVQINSGLTITNFLGSGLTAFLSPVPLIFRGECSDFHQSTAYFFTGLLSLCHTLSPRYTFYVLKNSIAPSPLIQAKHLDRMEPSVRDMWMKEWRSLRGGTEVKESRLSTPPSPTLETSVDFYPGFGDAASFVGEDMSLNVIGD